MMAKKAKQESQAEQSVRFLKAVQDLVDAGELNPIEAEDEFDRLMAKVAPVRLSPEKP